MEGDGDPSLIDNEVVVKRRNGGVGGEFFDLIDAATGGAEDFDEKDGLVLVALVSRVAFAGDEAIEVVEVGDSFKKMRLAQIDFLEPDASSCESRSNLAQNPTKPMKAERLHSSSSLKSLLLSGAIAGLTLISGYAEKASGTELRVWKTENGKHSVEASLISFNTISKRVTLQKEDSKTVEVPLSQLSAADQSYVRENAPSPKSAKKSSEAIRLHGITWQPEIEDALKLASGRSSADKRPVMWFRVLGKLDDGM